MTERNDVLFGNGMTQERVIVVTSTVKMEFRDMNRRTEVGATWTDEVSKGATSLPEGVGRKKKRLEL